MVSCALLNCNSRSGTDNKTLSGITFHRFPKEEERQKLWLRFVDRGDWKPSKNSVLCSKHFSEFDIDRTSKCSVRLRDNVVPTLKVFREWKGNTKRKNREIHQGLMTSEGLPSKDKTLTELEESLMLTIGNTHLEDSEGDVTIPDSVIIKVEEDGVHYLSAGSVIEETPIPSQNTHLDAEETETEKSDDQPPMFSIAAALDHFTQTYRDIERAKLKLQYYKEFGTFDNFEENLFS